MTPIELHARQTPNGHRAASRLEGTGLPYRVHVVDVENDAAA